ncbi:hypothetical protein SAMN02982994_0161 [Azospirillum lipoferum]|nr:hypothetical protein SAMN02982994_0161 [Azospirillum lipoferum]
MQAMVLAPIGAKNTARKPWNAEPAGGGGTLTPRPSRRAVGNRTNYIDNHSHLRYPGKASEAARA